MLTTLKWAEKYVKEFKWSVIPLKSGSKEPLILWSEYQKRLPTSDELEKWFSKTQSGLGIVTGRLSNISVIDVDTLTPLSVPISSIIAARTKRGRHFYFKYCEGLANHVKILENVDIRSEGGYVCAVPTAGYRWVNPYIRPCSLPAFPVGLLPKKEENNIRGNTKGRITELLEGLKEGNRDVSFTKIIGLLHRDHYSPADISAFLSSYAESSKFGKDALDEKIVYLTKRYDNGSHGEDDATDSLSVFMQQIDSPEWICEPIIGKGTIGFCAGLPETLKTWILLDLAIEAARGGDWLGKFRVRKSKVLFIDQERFKGEVQRRIGKLLAEKNINPKELDELYVQCGTTTRLDLEESYNAFRRKLNDLWPDLVIVDSFATFHTKEENNRKDIQVVLERVKALRQEFGCSFLFIDHENKSVLNPDMAGNLPDAFKMVGSVGKPAAAELVLTIRKMAENECTLYHTKSTLGPSIEPVKIKIVDTEKGVSILCA